jgi:hypothetical protein
MRANVAESQASVIRLGCSGACERPAKNYMLVCHFFHWLFCSDADQSWMTVAWAS